VHNPDGTDWYAEIRESQYAYATDMVTRGRLTEPLVTQPAGNRELEWARV
jgi:hypothetical protein